MKTKGKVFHFNDNVNTDEIIPARYLNTFDNETLASHCMEDINSNFSRTVNKGDIIIAGYNFGSGSSREHAPLAIKASGIQVVIAKSFARIFYRNAINIGLLVIEDEFLADTLSVTNRLLIDYTEKTITDLSSNISYPFELPDFVSAILNAGGLVECVKNDKLKDN